MHDALIAANHDAALALEPYLGIAGFLESVTAPNTAGRMIALPTCRTQPRQSSNTVPNVSARSLSIFASRTREGLCVGVGGRESRQQRLEPDRQTGGWWRGELASARGGRRIDSIPDARELHVVESDDTH